MANVKYTTVTRKSVRLAIQRPGGPGNAMARKWRRTAVTTAKKLAPVNDPLDAMHRGGKVGTYKRSFKTDKIGTNGSYIRTSVKNTAGHAVFVEEGRRASKRTDQRFSWTKWGGRIQIARQTRGRDGNHVLAKALKAANRAVGVT